MSEPLILYSTNTWLAYRIAQAYYTEKHYVWCAPYFSSGAVPAHDSTIPPSSSPGEIYSSLHADISRGDQHSTKIEMNKAGILRGANAKAKSGVISRKQRLEIYAIVSRAETRDFRPLVYVIPFHHVKSIIEEVPIGEKAHPLSLEYRVHELHRKHFDIVEFYFR